MRAYAALVLLALCAAGVTAADEPVGFAAGSTLAAKYNCQACHTTDTAKVGPSYRDIAKRYGSEPNAVAELGEHIVNGSSGSGGPQPMPATPVPDADLKVLVEWILSLGQA
jgi:cytochrome c